MEVPPPDPQLLASDLIVLQNLTRDIKIQNPSTKVHLLGNRDDNAEFDDKSTLQRLQTYQDEASVFCSWDLKDIPFSKGLGRTVLRTYVSWAQDIVRHPTDVVFLTHILLYLCTSLSSAIYLYYRFSYLHGVCHWIMQLYYCGSFTLMLHNHIHNNGVLAKRHAWFDTIWPYILEPLMGHTWDSYFYHHVKHHHVENNGPDDLSSTIRYQRDSLRDFLLYVGRFLAFIWIELPWYFVRKRKYDLAFKSAVSELSNYAFIYLMAQRNFKATLFVLILPLVQMRIGLMIGNFGQHALVDEDDPASDFRSSITLIDVPVSSYSPRVKRLLICFTNLTPQSNRYCFNDGWHTSHHLNPRRHWRDHPRAFLASKATYSSQQALVFQHIDYLMMTVHLLKKDYDYLAGCIVPIGDQIGMTKKELANLLRKKTKKFTEEEVERKFYRKGVAAKQ